MAETNVRARGKIPREEWSRIVDRFRKGETLAGIARRYQCTAPAIRYIVQRSDKLSGSAASDRVVEQDNRRADPGGGRDREQGRMPSLKEVASNSVGNDIWSRVNTDIATFLAAVDDLFVTNSDGNYEALLEATDRLLWASARTRLELERLIAGRKSATPRRRTSL